MRPWIRTSLLPALVVLGACGSAEATAPQLYTSNCGACHGPSGEGTGAGPSLLGTELSGEKIRGAVLAGIDEQDAFPAMAPVQGLDPAEIEQIIAHVLALRTGG